MGLPNFENQNKCYLLVPLQKNSDTNLHLN